MGFTPFKAGDGRTWGGQAFTTDSGIFTLTGLQNSAIAMHMQDINNDLALYICTGAWNITDGPGGKADFTPSPQDLSTGYLGKAGLYRIYPVVTLSSGPVPMDTQTITVIAEP